MLSRSDRADGGPAFIANTDFGWLNHFLHRAEPPDEVDFGQPSPHGFKAIPPGAPFFYRLGTPRKAIAGFGFFARCEPVPVRLAWVSFGDLNGTDTIAEMAARIEALTPQASQTTGGASRHGRGVGPAPGAGALLMPFPQGRGAS